MYASAAEQALRRSVTDERADVREVLPRVSRIEGQCGATGPGGGGSLGKLGRPLARPPARPLHDLLPDPYHLSKLAGLPTRLCVELITLSNMHIDEHRPRHKRAPMHTSNYRSKPEDI